MTPPDDSALIAEAERLAGGERDTLLIRLAAERERKACIEIANRYQGEAVAINIARGIMARGLVS